MLTPFRPDGAIDWPAYDQLVDWYIGSGAAGLFAVCLSSEMFRLSAQERLALARRAVQRAAGRVPVVATGTFGAGAAFSQRLADTGVAAVVCLTNHFAAEGSAEARWKAGLGRFLERLDPSIPLGLYECPRPYKRLLSGSEYRWALETGRFGFLKDTSCRMDRLRPRIRAGRGSGMRLYNANTPTLLASLRAGADGYSGIAANYVPRLYAWLCGHYDTQPALAERLQDFLTLIDPLIAARYPAAAKHFLHSAGLKIAPECRQPQPPLAEEDKLVLEAFRRASDAWHQELGLADPIFQQKAPKSS